MASEISTIAISSVKQPFLSPLNVKDLIDHNPKSLPTTAKGYHSWLHLWNVAESFFQGECLFPSFPWKNPTHISVSPPLWSPPTLLRRHFAQTSITAFTNLLCTDLCICFSLHWELPKSKGFEIHICIIIVHRIKPNM